MAQRIIKTVDQMIAPEEMRNKFKQLFVQSDELAWLGEHFNRETEDAECEIKDRRAQILKLRDQIIKGEITDFTDMLA